MIIFYSFFYSNKKIENNLFYFSQNQKSSSKKALFYFPNSDFMHLGDHLFFEPIIRLFKENEYEVEVFPAPIMSDYFINLKYKLTKEFLPDNFDIIVSSSRFILELKKVKNNVLLVETECPDINKALIDDVNEKIMKHFKFSNKVPTTPRYLDSKSDILKKFQINPNHNYIVFSNYLVSGSFRVFKNKFTKLEAAVINFKNKNNNYKVIHLGSKKDKLLDLKVYDFVDIDLRARTDLIDLFELCNAKQIDTYFGFDNFLMHLFFIKNKNLYIMSRGRWSKKSRFFLTNYIDPPFHKTNFLGTKKYL